MDESLATSTLSLAGRKHFKKPGIIFTHDMLDWTFFAELAITERSKMEIERMIHICALKALMTLPYPYTAKISIGVNLHKKELYFGDRTWGEIDLGINEAISFSTGKNNAKFYSLLDWPDLHTSREVVEYERVKGILQKWSIEDWKIFFKRKIEKKLFFLQKKEKESSQFAEKMLSRYKE